MKVRKALFAIVALSFVTFLPYQFVSLTRRRDGGIGSSYPPQRQSAGVVKRTDSATSASKLGDVVSSVTQNEKEEKEAGGEVCC